MKGFFFQFFFWTIYYSKRIFMKRNLCDSKQRIEHKTLLVSISILNVKTVFIFLPCKLWKPNLKLIFTCISIESKLIFPNFLDLFISTLIRSWKTLEIKTVITSPRNRGGVIFSLQFVCVSVCLSVCVCMCPALFLWTKFQPNGCTDWNAVFA